MKLHLSTFKCEFDEATEMVAVIETSDLKQFLNFNCISKQEFKPDFVNEDLNQFVFCTNNKEWRDFVDLFYFRAETKIELHLISTPDEFDIYRFFTCNPAIIHYILYPNQQRHMFLMESTMRQSNEYFINMMANALKNPSESKIRTLYQFKMFWNKSNGGQHNLLSYRKRFFTWFSNSFPKIYCWLWDNIISESKVFSESLQRDFLVSSKALITRECDAESLYSVEMDFPF
jgi:hypothetical protein